MEPMPPHSPHPPFWFSPHPHTFPVSSEEHDCPSVLSTRLLCDPVCIANFLLVYSHTSSAIPTTTSHSTYDDMYECSRLEETKRNHRKQEQLVMQEEIVLCLLLLLPHLPALHFHPCYCHCSHSSASDGTCSRERGKKELFCFKIINILCHVNGHMMCVGAKGEMVSFNYRGRGGLE